MNFKVYTRLLREKTLVAEIADLPDKERNLTRFLHGFSGTQFLPFRWDMALNLS